MQMQSWERFCSWLFVLEIQTVWIYMSRSLLEVLYIPTHTRFFSGSTLESCIKIRNERSKKLWIWKIFKTACVVKSVVLTAAQSYALCSVINDVRIVVWCQLIPFSMTFKPSSCTCYNRFDKNCTHQSSRQRGCQTISRELLFRTQGKKKKVF